MDDHTDAGALGVRMIDGSGSFLPESKRSFPSPFTSLFKLVGLTSLFPKSKLFARYTLGHLNEFDNHAVDVLAGAFMLLRAKVLRQLKGFDETFFMYGEDVDLSYRILKAGFKNYYFSGTSIIHFKGESTKKGSLNYVKMFYQAMSIFVSKHYGGNKGRLFKSFIQIGIWLRATLAAAGNFFKTIGLPAFDALIIFGSFQLVNSSWVYFVREGEGFIPKLVNISLPGFTMVFLLAATFAGMYDNKYKPLKAFYAALVAIIIMLAVYSLLPEKYRFSRGVILLGGLTALLFITIFRWLLLRWKVVEVPDEVKRRQQSFVVASPHEFKQVQQLLKHAGYEENAMARIAVNGNREDAIGSIDQLPALLESAQLREIIFCEGTLSFGDIIKLLQQLPPHTNARFHAQKSSSIAGSDSKNAPGESFSVEGNYSLADPYQRRMKRVLDILFSIFILLTFPLHLLAAGAGVVKDAVLVLIGRKTWVGYALKNKSLPPLCKGVLATNGHHLKNTPPFSEKNLQNIDTWYAKTYDWPQDLKLIVKHYPRLGGHK